MEARGKFAVASPSGRGIALWYGSLSLLVAVGLYAFSLQLREGLAVTAMRNNVMWGLYIAFFMLFVGLSAGGLIVASAGRVFGVERFKVIARPAILTSAVCVLLAALFILPDLGRPERLLNLFLYGHWTSPMIWDVTIILVYLALSLVYLWLYLRVDLIRAGSPLAFGAREVTPVLVQRLEKTKNVVAAIALPAAVLIHSITAWIFGLQISRDYWYSAIMAPFFISSALVSGLALVILVTLLLRRAGRLSFEDGLVSWLGGLLATFIAVDLFLLLSEVLTAMFPGAPAHARTFADLLWGRYGVLFWTQVTVGSLVPFGLMVMPSVRRSVPAVAAASVLAILGIALKRVNIVLGGLSRAPIEAAPGTPVGTWSPGTLPFEVVSAYSPTWVEWAVVLGLLALGALLLTAGARTLPLEEHPTHG